ncbi:hypothetical protein IY145_13890 [Methylosinus sp. H3A]|nr:hypothetical protein [Methylosinus sp. H3A]
MSALTIDTLAVSQIEIGGSQLMTKSDLKEAVADLKVDILRWLVVTQLALGGFIFAAIKFMR